jgi:hypothetical protein
MKTRFILLSSLCLTALILALGNSCEESTIKEVDASVTTRDDDCEECEECCCAISLDGDTEATLHICGTTDGAGACSATTNCVNSDPSGGGQFVSLTSSLNPWQTFCMAEETALRITNLSSTDDADVTLTCQYKLGNPQTIQITIPANSTEDVDVDGDCEVEQCN